MKVWFAIYQIDAWHDGEGWYYNQSYEVGYYKTGAKDLKRAALRNLAKRGIRFKKGTIRVESCFDGYEVVERKTGMPLYFVQLAEF